MCDRYAFFDAQSWLTPRDDVEEAGDEEEGDLSRSVFVLPLGVRSVRDGRARRRGRRGRNTHR